MAFWKFKIQTEIEERESYVSKVRPSFERLVINYNNNSIHISNKAYGLLNIDASIKELTIEDLFISMHKDDKHRIIIIMSSAIFDMNYINEVFRIYDKNLNEKIIKCIGFLRNNILDCKIFNITKIYKLNSRLLLVEKKYKALVENTPIGITITKKGEIIYVNRIMTKLLKFEESSELKGKNVLDFIVNTDKIKVSKIIREIHETDDHISMQKEFKILDKNGNVKLLDLYFSTFLHNQEKYVQTMVMDITDQMDTQKKIMKLTLDSLYIEQYKQKLNTIKKELDIILNKKNNQIEKSDFHEIYMVLNSYCHMEKDKTLFINYIDEIYPNFITELKQKYPQLTLNELKHCVCIKLNFETKQIANLFHVKPTSVQIARVRLKKKFNLKNDDDLREFILCI